jgi:hypothetical protein
MQVQPWNSVLKPHAQSSFGTTRHPCRKTDQGVRKAS